MNKLKQWHRKNIRKPAVFFRRMLLFCWKHFWFAFNLLFRRRFRYNALYVRRMKKPINANAFFYDSFDGKTAGDSPFAIFKYLIENPEYGKFLHIWTVNNPENSPLARYLKRPDVITVKKNRRKYYKYLATSKYLINNSTLSFSFVKREGQILLNSWHGTPLKTLGKHMKTEKVGSFANTQRNLISTDYFVNPNHYTAEKMLDSYDIADVFPGKVAETGYPRVDLILRSDRNAIRRALSVGEDERLILYVPTWRGQNHKFVVDNTEKYVGFSADIAQGLPTGYKLLVKLHHFQVRQLSPDMVSCAAPQNFDVNELLCAADILITDYSSVFFDFLCTRRPILFFTYDREEYLAERGTYFPMDELPGPLCATTEELLFHIRNAGDTLSQYQTQHEKFIQKFSYLDDGNASKRAVELLLYGKETDGIYSLPKTKKNILFYPGDLVGRDTTQAALGLLRRFDYERYNVTCIVDKKKDAFNVSQICPKARILYTVGGIVFGRFDRYPYYDFAQSTHPSGSAAFLKKDFFRREAMRSFGTVCFDTVIDFSGTTRYMTALLSFTNAKNKLIFLRTDMAAEHKTLYPHLISNFNLYSRYDKLVCLSDEMREQNLRSLSPLIPGIEKKLCVAETVIDPELLHDIAKASDVTVLEGIESYTEYKFRRDEMESVLYGKAIPLPKEDEIGFIHIGQMMPGENQATLLRAFAGVVKKYPNARLYLVGGGSPTGLRRQADRLGLRGLVVITGDLRSLQTLLSRCRCLLVPSRYLRHPMDMLHAYLQKMSAITADIPGARALAAAYGGTVVPSGETKDWRNAMIEFLKTGNSQTRFDAETHNLKALGQLSVLLEAESTGTAHQSAD